MRVLITGTSGHIGGAIARHLHDCGHEVLGVSRSINSALPDTVFQFPLDITEGAFFREACALAGQCDAVVHAAACLDPHPNRAEVSRVNCFGTHQVLNVALQSGAHCLVFISGLNLLGAPGEHPVTESHPLAPRTAYAASKAYGEALTALLDNDHLRCISLRVSSPVGPGLRRKRLFFALVEAAGQGQPLILHGSGERCQDYVDVRDVGMAVEQVLTHEARGVFHVASGQPVSNKALAQRCIRALNSSSEIRWSGFPDPEEGMVWDVCIDKARTAFGFAPAYTLEDSIQALAAEGIGGKGKN